MFKVDIFKETCMILFNPVFLKLFWTTTKLKKNRWSKAHGESLASVLGIYLYFNESILKKKKMLKS